MKIIILLVTLSLANFASAGLLIEPQVGYVLSSKYNGTISLSGPSNATLAADYKASGAEYGARLGYQFLGFMTGLNYGHSSGTSKNSDGTSDDFKTTNMGAFVGFNAPILLRGWFAYNFSAKSTYQTTDFKGSSTEAGLGFTGVPFLSINLIYRMYKYTEVSSLGVTYNATNFNPKEVELAVSIPLNLF